MRWALAILLVSTAADAKPVPTGDDTRVAWRSPNHPTQLVDVDAYDETVPDQISLHTNGSAPAVGARFVVLDDKGWLGTIEVTQVDDEPNTAAGTVYHTITAKLLQGSGRQQGSQIVALGPIFGISHRGRILPLNAKMRSPSSGAVSLAVDLDGDGQPDLEEGVVDCGRRAIGEELECSATWTRTEGAWSQTDQAARQVDQD